ncbi:MULTISPECIES: hypothetical protein [unclassified Bradyrhizobium]|uniref:hypothetical protein n=1 Tax=unclassified Bradyrhizobium TaxID=2631580 RepID=UPI002915D5C3|nr:MULTISPECIES: hypothetical protein [unclassified Bradyrhizobium]
MRALTSELSRTERRIASYTSSIELSVDVARAITNRSSDKDVAAALGHIVEGGFTYVTEPLIILGAKWLVKSAFVAIFAPEATAFVVAQLGFAGGEKLYEKVFKKSVNEFIADSVVPFARHPIERTELMLSDVQRRIENLLLENVDLSRPTP